MATEVYKKCLSEFGWKSHDLKDQNWKCVEPDHNKKTHPSDVVFWYDDPYSQREVRTFVTTDLKSYASTSLQKSALEKALTSLCMSTECANISEHFREQYIGNDINAEVVGLLFIYNHDNQYDKSFRSVLRSIPTSKLKLKRNRRVYVMGPEDVIFTYNIALDLKMRRGDNEIPDKKSCEFFYPDLVQVKARNTRNPAATLETILGSQQIIKYRMPSKSGEIENNFLVYYRGEGKNSEEFLYLIDAFFRFQMLQNASRIILCLPKPHERAHSYFKHAVDTYVDRFHNLKAIRDRLEIIDYQPMNQFNPQFSENNLGMRL